MNDPVSQAFAFCLTCTGLALLIWAGCSVVRLFTSPKK